MKIAIGNDRNGLEYKNKLLENLKEEGYEVIDCGTNENIPADYPIYAEKVGKLVSSKECDKGILICATGIGICIAANKINGIRAGIGYFDDVCRLMRNHNDANILVFGQDYMTIEDVMRRTKIFLKSPFLGSYHETRIKQISDLEKGKKIFQTKIINENNHHERGK